MWKRFRSFKTKKTELVVYENAQMYPAYLVTYKSTGSAGNPYEEPLFSQLQRLDVDDPANDWLSWGSLAPVQTTARRPVVRSRSVGGLVKRGPPTSAFPEGLKLVPLPSPRPARIRPIFRLPRPST